MDFDRWASRPGNISTWRIPPGASGGLVEAETTMDSDDDGVMDFDETRRFRTDPRNKDSDRDLVPDKEDIASGVFEIEFNLGYAVAVNPTDSGRDYDGDRLPTERDPDSDNGGCLDGDEDLNRDGFRTNPEHSNFDPSDDVCGSLSGSITFTHAFVNDIGGIGGVITTMDETVTVTIRFKTDPAMGPEHFVDDGSRFALRQVATLLIPNPGCPIASRQTAVVSGAFSDTTNVGGGLSPDGLTLAIGVLADVQAHVVTDSCLNSESGVVDSTFSLPDCIGRRVGRPVDRTYTFNCAQPPSPPTPGLTFRWSVTGTVRLR